MHVREKLLQLSPPPKLAVVVRARAGALTSARAASAATAGATLFMRQTLILQNAFRPLKTSQAPWFHVPTPAKPVYAFSLRAP